MKKVKVLNVDFDYLTIEALVEQIPGLINSKKSSFIVTANPEIVMFANKDGEFAEIIANADVVTADGIGVVIASKIIGEALPERVTGMEIIGNLFRLGEEKGYKFYFLGAKEGVAQEAAKKVKLKFPKLKIVGTQHGFFKDEAELLKDIEDKKPDILLVALGMGRQEKWIWQHKDQLGVPLSIGVGGSFDVLAGRVKRAPLWMQKTGLEWFFRLIQEPSRYKRMMILPYFLMQVLRSKFKGDKL